MSKSFYAIMAAALLMGPAAPAISITVAPKISFNRQDIRYTVRIDPHRENRYLKLVVDGPQYMAQDFDLEGEDAPRIFQRWFKSVPAGQYEAAAILLRANGQRFIARDTFCIAGPASDCQ